MDGCAGRGAEDGCAGGEVGEVSCLAFGVRRWVRLLGGAVKVVRMREKSDLKGLYCLVCMGSFLAL